MKRLVAVAISAALLVACALPGTPLVQPTESRFCNDGDDPFVDVSFTLAGRSAPLVVSVGRSEAGRLVVCAY